MKLISYIQNSSDIDFFTEIGINRGIIAIKPFATLGVPIDDGVRLIKLATSSGLKVSLEMDCLFEESEFQKILNKVLQLPLDSVVAVRIADIGLARFFKQSYPKIKIELWAKEMGANFEALSEYEKYFKGILSTIILSAQLSKTQLTHFCSKLNCETEVLTLGRIPLFYSPRHLLTGEGLEKDLEVTASSEETPHRGFSVVENSSGTLMFHPKDLFLMDKVDELSSLGISRCRIDVRHLPEKLARSIITLCHKLVNKNSALEELKEIYPNKVIRGYYRANRSDVLFSKLKNKYLVKDDSVHIGYVLAAKKGDYMAIMVEGPHELSVGQDIVLTTPEGKKIKTKVSKLFNSTLDELEQAPRGLLCFMNYTKGVSVKTVLQKI